MQRLRLLLASLAVSAVVLSAAAAAPLEIDVRLVSEDETTITLGWPQESGAHSLHFLIDGRYVSWTRDGTRTTVRFSKNTACFGEPNCYQVESVVRKDIGGYPKPAPPPPPPPPPPGTTLVFTNATWTCTQPVANLAVNGLPLRVVMNYTVNFNGFGVRLGAGCRGDGTSATDLVLNINGDGLTYGPQEDAIRVMNALPGASNLEITGYANCGRREISAIHQDGIQVLGGTNITWVDFQIGYYDAGRSTCQGAGGAFFYSLESNNTRVEGGQFIACNHSLLAGNGSGHVSGASFRSGRNDGSDPACDYNSSDPCLFQSPQITHSGLTCQRWNPATDEWRDVAPR